MKRIKSLLCGILAAALLLSAIPAHAASGFSDVSDSDYYAKAVAWAKEAGVTGGTGGGTFSPKSPVTRGQAVTFLWAAAGRPEPASDASPFIDVADPSAYYYKPVLWAKEKGVTSGVSDSLFGVDSTLHYDQFLAFLCRAAGDELSGGWSQAAMSWAGSKGLTSGLSVAAGSDCPRADVVYFLWKQYGGASSGQTQTSGGNNSSSVPVSPSVDLSHTTVDSINAGKEHPRGSLFNTWGYIQKLVIPGQPLASYSHSYVDVPKDHPNYDAIMLLTENGIFTSSDNEQLAGCAANEFKPDDQLTRNQLSGALGRLTAGERLPSSYDWSKSGNVDGYYPHLDNAPATRTWAAVVLAGKMRNSSNWTGLTLDECDLIGNIPGLKRFNNPDVITQNGRHVNSMNIAAYDIWRANLLLGKKIDYKYALTDFADSDKIAKQIEDNYDPLARYLLIAHKHKPEIIEECKYNFMRAWNLGIFHDLDENGSFGADKVLTRGEFCQILYDTGWLTPGCYSYRVYDNK